MVEIVQNVADRFLNVFAPRLTAKADPCSCSGHWSYCDWNSYCYRIGSCAWYRLRYCDGCQQGSVCDCCWPTG